MQQSDSVGMSDKCGALRAYLSSSLSSFAASDSLRLSLSFLVPLSLYNHASVMRKSFASPKTERKGSHVISQSPCGMQKRADDKEHEERVGKGGGGGGRKKREEEEEAYVRTDRSK